MDIQNECDGLQQKFQHAECFTCDPLITQPGFSNSFHCDSQQFIGFSMIAHTIIMIRRLFLVVIASNSSQVNHCRPSVPLQVQDMPDVARVIIASKRCLSYYVVVKSQGKRAFSCNVCKGLTVQVYINVNPTINSKQYTQG